MRESGTSDYRSIVTKKVGCCNDGCTKIPQNMPNDHSLSIAGFAPTNSEPYVAVSTVPCLLEYQTTGVLLTKWRHPVQDLSVAKQWF